MKTYNTTPYYDDFDSDKNFQQILFKPGYSVQARELTQLQSILKDQIAKFGNHIFKHGSVVLPGNTTSDLNVPYVKITSVVNAGSSSITNFENKIIVGNTSGIKAVVKTALPATTTDPITFYVMYLTGGGASTPSNVFANNEVVYLEESPAITATVMTADGNGSLASINSGVFYINGSFVHVDTQSIVISKYDTLPSCSVVLKITETIEDSSTDETLLDPAQGSYNYAAPGADRTRITLTLTSLPLGSAIDDNYVELMRFQDGVLKENSRYPSYSELEKSLARRTYDESGDYLVNGFKPTIREHLKTLYNSGVYADGNRDKFIVDVSPGKGYIQGYETEILSNTRLEFDRARTAAQERQSKFNSRISFGSYMYVSDLKLLPNFKNKQTVDLYNTSDAADGGSTLVGTMRVTAIDYFIGDPATTNAIYKLYYDNLALTGAYTLSDVGGFKFGANGSGAIASKYIAQNSVLNFQYDEIINATGSSRTAKVKNYNKVTGELYVLKRLSAERIPAVGDFVTGATSGATSTVRSIENSVSVGTSAPLFAIPLSPIKSLTNVINDYDASYVVWKTFTINTSVGGGGSFSITDGTFLPPEAGVTTAAGTAGTLNVNTLSLSTPTTFTITGGPASDTVIVSTQVLKSNSQPKTKTKNSIILNSVTPNATISLGKADIHRIVSIYSDGVDITDSYSLNNGQTDSYYGIGFITLNGALPTEPLTISFEYFTHVGSGDYLSVDSYTTLGVDYLSNIPSYRSKSNIYSLKNFVDFRPRMGDDGTFTGSGASTNDSPVVGAFFNSSAKYFTARIDVVYLSKDKKILTLSSTPSDTPVKPTIPNNALELFSMHVPAYTTSIATIVTSKPKNKRFTMQDINTLQDRVSNVEYYSTLNALENTMLTYQVSDAATGLNRYKTGYLVDNFDNPFNVCDYFNTYTRANFVNRQLSASKEAHDSALTFVSTSTNYDITEGQVTLPYVEVDFISQKTSTRVTNLNPFLVLSWQGVMTIEPKSDSWVVVENLPEIFKSETNTVVVTREERVEVLIIPAPTPVDPPVWDPPEPAPIPVPTPTPTPVTPELSTVTVWARDIGLPGDNDGDGIQDLISFSVPKADFDGNLNTLNTWQEQSVNMWAESGANSGFANEPAWMNVISAINDMADIAGIDRGASGADIASAVVASHQTGQSFVPLTTLSTAVANTTPVAGVTLGNRSWPEVVAEMDAAVARL